MREEETLYPPTRTQFWRSIVLIATLWVFLIAIVAQNFNRVQQPSASSAPAVTSFTPHDVLLYVTHDGQVMTMAEGVGLPHVPLHDCPRPELKIKTSDIAPTYAPSEALWLGDTRIALNILADQPYSVISSYVAVEVRFADDSYVRVMQDCQAFNQDIPMFVFVTQERVFLGDAANGAVTPLFSLAPSCALVWNTGNGDKHAYYWDMPLTLSTDGFIGDDSRVAFTFMASGDVRFDTYTENWAEMTHNNGTISVYADCAIDNLPTPNMP